MKKLLILVSILSILNYSCSKKEHTIIAAPPLLVEYPIDLNFTINPKCSIEGDSYIYEPNPDLKYFHFFAGCDSNLPNDASGSYINISQTIFSDYYPNDSIPQIIISTREQSNINYFGIIPDSSDFNVFNLPYQNGFASFSGTCQVAAAPASMKYHTMSSLKTRPLTYSGYFDLLNSTGNFRIKGSVYLPK